MIWKLWDVVVTLIGADMTDAGAEQWLSEVLTWVQEKKPKAVVFDATRVGIMDTHLSSVVCDGATAVQLMGGRVVLCGVSPEVAATIVAAGFDEGFHKVGVLFAFDLEVALDLLGVRDAT